MTWRVLIIVLIVAISSLFFIGLGRDPREIPSPLIGKMAPAFSGVTAEGQPFAHEQVKGKVALVSFWATWCTTCKADEPLIEAIYGRFATEPNFQVVGIATQDSLGNVQDYLKRGTRPYTNLYDNKGKLAIDFGVYGVPETYLIDRQGNIVSKIVGPINPQKLEKQIADLLRAEKAG